MDFITNFPLFTIVLSLFSSVLCTMFSGKAARNYTIFFEVFLLGLTGAVLWYTAVTGCAFTYTMGEFPAPWGNEIRAGVLEALMGEVFLGIIFCSVLAGRRFIDEDMDESKVNLYYTLINLMTAATMAMLWTNDIFTGYVFLEILTLSSCGVLIVRELGRTTLAAVRYMILNLLGSGLYLLGVVLLYDITGHLLMIPMQEQIALLSQNPDNFMIITLAVGILTIGLGIKSGLFPFYFWMPDTYGAATPTSGSVMSAVVSKCYIFLLFKIYWRVVGIEVFEQMPLKNILLVLGIAGVVMGSVQALHAESANRMVAFSSAAQIGYIYMGIGIGGIAGYTAAMFHILAHAVTKSALFLTIPRLSEVSGQSMRFKHLQGSGLRNREAGLVFLMGALSMIGIPLFAGFSTKLFFGMAAVYSGSNVRLILVMVALAVSSVLNALYFLRTAIRVFTRSENEMIHSVRGAQHAEPGIWHYRMPMVLLIGANLSMGMVSWFYIRLIQNGLSMFG